MAVADLAVQAKHTAQLRKSTKITVFRFNRECVVQEKLLQNPAERVRQSDAALRLPRLGFILPIGVHGCLSYYVGYGCQVNMVT